MAYLPPVTVADTLRRIQREQLILPAIQREYVWKPSQVVTLFDSLMRGYPIGSFLSWRVEADTAVKFRFYGFLKDYNEYNARHNPVLDIPAGDAVTALLDGQQRLTSLNIGLRGTYAYKNLRAWRNNPENYPTRTLYLNVLREAEENEPGLRYDFRFLTPEQLNALDSDEARYWFPVQRVYETDDLGDLWDLAGDAGLANDRSARNMLSQLWKAVHSTTGIHIYEETDQDVERVLDIFIRVNSSGTVLSYSDLLLSIATAQWKGRDARSAIHGLIDTLNSTGQGFNFNQDVVLKSGLVLGGIKDIGFKVKNFTADNMAILDREWDGISESLKLAAGLLSDFGLSGATLSAASVLIPIAYYVHRRGLTQSYRTSVAHAADRDALRAWTLRSLIAQGVWGSGLDSLLRDISRAIDDHADTGFPVSEIEKRMAARGKSLVVTREQVEDILTSRYGKPRTFAVLATVFSYVNTRNVHHVDHVFPRALLTRTRLKQAGFDNDAIDDIQGKLDQLANLQLLEGSVNISKSDTSPDKWASATFMTPDSYQAYLERNCIPWMPKDVNGFDAFFTARRDALSKRIMAILGDSTTPPSGAAHVSTIVSIDEELAETG